MEKLAAPLIVDARALPEFDDVDVTDWTDEDFRWFDNFVDAYMRVNVYPVYELLIQKLDAGTAKTLTKQEVFAVAALHGVPLEIVPEYTDLDRGCLGMRTACPVHFAVRGSKVIVTPLCERGSGEEPERTGD